MAYSLQFLMQGTRSLHFFLMRITLGTKNFILNIIQTSILGLRADVRDVNVPASLNNFFGKKNPKMVSR